MISDAGELVQAAVKHVSELLKMHLPDGMYFHDLAHTLETTETAREIGRQCGLSPEELELLTLAALFHDTGYTQLYKDHELVSARMAREFFQKAGLSAQSLDTIEGCILATRMPQQPMTLLEEIICDSDMMNVASEHHFEKSEQLRREWSARQIHDFSDEGWCIMEVDFLTNHKFRSAWAQTNWEAPRQKNLERAKQELEAVKQRKSEKKAAKDLAKELKKSNKSKASGKVDRPDRGIETMFRTAARNHINLSSIADNKANIMLSINALIISVVISGLAPKMDTNPSLVIPTTVILAVCILTIVFATLSTRPKITRGRFDREDINSKRANLIFFGNFYNMKLEDFEWGMGEMMKDRDFLYGSLTRDLYYLGVVLARKYYFLRLTYTIFMWGLIVAVLAFAIAFYIEARN